MRHLKICSLLFPMLAAWAWAGTGKNFEESFPVGANASFSLEHHKGQIKVRVGGGNTIEFKAHAYFEKDVDAKALDMVQFKKNHSGDNVRVEIEYDFERRESKGIFNSIFGNENQWESPLVDVEVILPAHCRLTIESHKGSFDVETPEGTVEIDSHKGVGIIKGVRGDFTLDSHKGNFEIEVLALANFKVDTHKGQVNVEIHGARDFAIYGSSHDGDFGFSGRQIKVSQEDGESMVFYSEGSGKHRIELESHKGKINLKFID